MGSEAKKSVAKSSRPAPSTLFNTSVLVILVSTCMLGVACLYWWRFHQGGLSHDPHDWNEFAGYLGGVLGPILAMVNLLVLAKTAFDFRLQDQKYQKAKLMFELSQQWTALNDTRHEADDVIRDHPHATCRELHHDPKIHEHALWKVLGFFKELQFAISEGVVDEMHAISLFGQVYVWWYVVGAKKDYPHEWDYTNRLEALYVRFEQLEPDEFPKWEEYAEVDLLEYQSAVPKTDPKAPN